MTNSPNAIGSKQGVDALQSIFGRKKVVIGVVHLAPLPGAPRYDGEAVETIYQRGLDDAKAYLNCGFGRGDGRKPSGEPRGQHAGIPAENPPHIGLRLLPQRLQSAGGL